MSTHRNIDRICVAVAVLSLLLTVLFMNGEALGITLAVDKDAEIHSDSVYFTANDLDGAWDPSDATVITLSGSGGTVSGTGAYFLNGSVYIVRTGRYILSGTLTDGSIVVNAYKTSKVWLGLMNVDVTCSDNACLRVEQADKVFLTLTEGSVNSFKSGAAYKEESLADCVDGAIFARDDLTVNGSGSLSVQAEWRHGIAANDDLVITGGDITVTAAKDAIHVNDTFRVTAATLDLTSEEDDGIDLYEETGYFYAASGVFRITSADDGISAAADIRIDGGSFAISAGDDGIRSDTAFRVTGGDFQITDCYEGIEARVIEVSGGDFTVYPTDDGFNANGGTVGFGAPGGFQTGDRPDETGAPAESANIADTQPYILISGGTVTVINNTARDADGLDSNGSIYITGGDIRISLIDSGTNNAIDFGSESGGVCEISGGTVIACGSSNMTEGFSSSSSQCSLLCNLSSGAEAGSEVSLEDSAGNTLLSCTVPCSFSSVTLSCPQMQVGDICRVVINGSAEEVTLTGTAVSLGGAQGNVFGGRTDMGRAADPRGERQDGAERPGGGEAFDPGTGVPPEAGEPPETGEMPEMGQPPETGDFPGMGQHHETGQPPQMNEQPETGQPPEAGEIPEAPGSDPGDAPQGGTMPGGEILPGFTGQTTGTQGRAGSTGAPDTPAFEADSAFDGTVTPAMWVITGACALVLLLGIFIAWKYRA